MAGAAVSLQCTILLSTPSEAIGLLGSVAYHIRVGHTPDLRQVEQALRKAVVVLLAATGPAADKSMTAAEAQLAWEPAHAACL
jgi:hypothetical protein